MYGERKKKGSPPAAMRARQPAILAEEETQGARTIPHIETTGAFLAKVPTLVLSREELNVADLDHRDYFLVSLMDGNTTVENVLDISGMPSEEALALLESLIRRGILKLEG
jgi:hypothetical protein